MLRTVGASVEFRQVTVRYGARTDAPTTAVEDLTLGVGAGEICVLLGPSGCGKTTTLRLVNRLIEPTSGAVWIDGQDVRASDPVLLRRGIGYVIQQVGLFPHQTIAENVGAVPRLLGWHPDRIRCRVDELLALIGLEPARVRERYPAQLSGGERQRVGVARALAAEPPLLLMDEPFGAVDPVVRERLQDEFLDLQRSLGTTVIFVTHDVDEATKLATRVAILRAGGRLAQYGSPAEVLTRPVDEHVATFLGADRALKRLALVGVRDLALRPFLVDSDAAPGGALPMVAERANARDALVAILSSPARVAVVTDGAGVPRGLLTLDAISAVLAPARGETRRLVGAERGRSGRRGTRG